MKYDNQLLHEVVQYILRSSSAIYNIDWFMSQYNADDQIRIKRILRELSDNLDSWPSELPRGTTMIDQAQRMAKLACTILKIS
jgi:hypothetical protein